MKSSIAFATNKLGWVAVGLMGLQVVFKLALEIRKAFETGNLIVGIVAILFTLGWVTAIPLCIRGSRLGYWLGASLGLMHAVMTISVPVAGICDHYAIAAIVVTHGLLIAAACLVVLVRDARQTDPSRFIFISKAERWAYLVLCAATVVRVVWITFREPTGAARAAAATAGKGGLAEVAGISLIYVVVISMAALCVIIPGIVLRRSWAYTAAAWFGALMVALTAANVVMMVNQGSGPAVVIPSSLGMLIGGVWMLNARSGSMVMQPGGQGAKLAR